MEYWGLDPLWDANIRCSISFIRSLEPATNDEQCSVFILPKSRRVVSKFRILGDVVSFEEKSLFWSFVIDDGTGLLRCLIWKDDVDTVISDDAPCHLSITMSSVSHFIKCF